MSEIKQQITEQVKDLDDFEGSDWNDSALEDAAFRKHLHVLRENQEMIAALGKDRVNSYVFEQQQKSLFEREFQKKFNYALKVEKWFPGTRVKDLTVDQKSLLDEMFG